MSNIDVRVEGAAEQFANPGAQLAQLREQQGYSLDYVAEKLRLRPTLLADLECDNYSLLPHSVFVKGYLRGYAKLLGVDSNPYIISYETTFGVEEPKIERVFRQSQRYYSAQEKKMRWLSGGVMLMLLLIVTVWWQKDYLANKNSLGTINNAVFSKNDLQRSTSVKSAEHLPEATQSSIVSAVLASPEEVMTSDVKVKDIRNLPEGL